MNTASCVIVILINQALVRHGGDLAVGAYGIINRVIFLFAMIVMGLNQGMQPIAGYNYGAGNYKRVNKVLKQTIIVASLIVTFGFLVGEIFPDEVASVFTNDETLIGLASNGLRLVLIFFPIVGFQMVTTFFFQSIGMAGKSIFLSLTRQLLFLLPFLIIFPSYFGVNGVWYSMPAADILSSIVAGYMLVVQYRKFKRD
jgi:Na+-driven multidrug efflux pump